MQVLLTSSCCGKTALEAEKGRYIDFDLFSGVKTRRQRAIIKTLISVFAEECADRDKIYLMNINQFIKWELKDIKSLEIVDIVIPSPEMFKEMVSRFRKRDMANGAVRQDILNYFKINLHKNIENGQELATFFKCPLHFFRKGEYLNDYLHRQSV